MNEISDSNGLTISQARDIVTNHEMLALLKRIEDEDGRHFHLDADLRSELQRVLGLSGNTDELQSAATRMLVGITKESTAGCDWYEGIEHDAAAELQDILRLSEGSPYSAERRDA